MSVLRILFALIFIGANLLIALWDLYCLGISKPNETVSYVMGEWGRDFPILPLFIGLVIGHVFWPRVAVR